MAPFERQLTSKVNCGKVTCGRFAQHKTYGTCDGPASSDDCQDSCCEAIRCDHIKDWSCSNEVGSGFFKRQVPEILKGLHRHSLQCKGEEQCKDRCCQSTCKATTCEEPYLCKKPYAPKKCTASECQSQCCYDKSYCGNGINAWSYACKRCKSKLEYCEQQVGDRSSFGRDQWNDRVLKLVKAGKLAPGCEEDAVTPDCRNNLKYGVLSKFLLHKSDEGVSVNTVAVVPGGTEALSGGDDEQVFKWRIADGHFLRNYSSHTAPIRQVFPLKDATFLCAATNEEAIVWLVQAGHDYKDAIEMEFTPEDPREGAGPVGVTGCIGLNSYETLLVGLTNSFAVLWEFKVDHFMPVPTDPKLEYMWQIDKDFGYYKKWPWWDKQDVVKTAVKEWEKNRFHLHDGYARRLRGNDLGNGNASRELFDMDKGTIPWLYHKLHRSSPLSPWDNTFTNLRWGDVPDTYYEPDGWGAVTVMVEIPSDTLFVIGYEDGSIRTWHSYNGFIVAVIPKAHAGAVNAMVAAPAGGNFYSAGADGFIRVWESSSGKFVREIYAAWAGPIGSLAMIPGGNAIYSGHFSGTIYLWAVDGTALCHLDTEGGKVNSLAVNDGSIGQVLTALENGEVRVYAQGGLGPG
ncbi:WD repeat-containing protein tag-125 [Durusdinium trenchii]